MNPKVSLKIPYGNGILKFSLPRNRLLGVLQNPSTLRQAQGRPEQSRRTTKAQNSVPSEVEGQNKTLRLLEESLDEPLGGYRLEDKVSGLKEILIVVPDSTRKAHLKEILPYIFKRIKNKSRTIDIIIATGLHKKHGAQQLKELLGERVFHQHKIIGHEQDGKSLANFGWTRSGVPIILNKHLKRYDCIISIGLIEPHLYAGYSGGAKTIAIGLAGEYIINVTHGIKFLDNPLTKIGLIKDNPFQRTLWEMIDKVPVKFSVNILNSPDGKVLKIFSGELKKVFTMGAAYAKAIFEVEAKIPSDIVICGIGYPKDVNLYQASRAINYILNDKPVIKKGGVLIVVAEMRDGCGYSQAEKRFFGALKHMSSPKEFVEMVRRKGCIAGEHRAYMVAKPLLDYNIAFAGNGRKKFMEGLPFPYFENIYDALHYADSIVGRGSKIYVIPLALSTIARLKS